MHGVPLTALGRVDRAQDEVILVEQLERVAGTYSARGPFLAELALDRVAYRVPVEAVLYEVEIEAKGT